MAEQEKSTPEPDVPEESVSQADQAAANGDPAAEVEAAEMELLLEDARAKADEHWDLVLRTRAEMENLKRRTERELANAHKYGLERFAGDLLPVMDSMELGLQAAGDPGADVEKLREGTDLTLKLFANVLEKFGIQQIDPQGEPFNPERHQAMSTQITADVDPNTVVTVYQKGYMLNDRLLRPAMVVVSQREGGNKVDEKA